MLVTYYDCYVILSKVYGGGSFIKQALSNTVIEEKNRTAVTKICYGVLDKDITLEYILENFCAKRPKLAVRTLIKIAIYSIKYLETPPHLVTDTIVELCKKLGKQGVAGFVNAVIRNYLRKGVAFSEDNSAKSLSIKYSCPQFIVEKLIKDYGVTTAVEFLIYDEEKTYIRFNLEVNGDKYLSDLNLNYQKTVFDNLFEVKNFKQNADFHSGKYTFQSIGSVAICNVLNGGETLLDCCSAPGGKAVLLSDKYKFVTACDIHAHRVELIKSYALRMNKANVTAILKDGTVYDSDFDGKFSAVLCDVPCSGTGVMKENPDIKLNRNENSIKELSKLQLSILKNASNYVEVGGELIYSTCSVLKEENDLVVSEFIKDNINFEVINISSPLNCLTTEFGLQFLPNISCGAGFYVCKLKRTK